MAFWQQLILGFLVCIFGSGGVAWLVVKLIIKETAKEALKESIEEIKKLQAEFKKDIKDEIEKLHKRANKIEDEFVTCKFCTMQHDNLTKTLENMDNKLDILISNATVK